MLISFVSPCTGTRAMNIALVLSIFIAVAIASFGFTTGVTSLIVVSGVFHPSLTRNTLLTTRAFHFGTAVSLNSMMFPSRRESGHDVRTMSESGFTPFLHPLSLFTASPTISVSVTIFVSVCPISSLSCA
ncbi:hypothetical protein JB92DRAFT_607872 [Gautieria morchelliformis]|nr:hypothetical protein JB92DRAFT_607872 [Gautieria morchelliformis]